MSGWIKLEKDLLTDPRFVASAMELEERYGLAHKAVTDRNVTTLPASTLLLGALARIWIIADTHIGEDDILALSAHQIDKLVGIKGLCEILPNDWLQVLDGDRVKLPNYHAHNGTTAKERSGNALRQKKFRDRHKRSTVTSRNAVTLPDLDQDLDKTKKKEQEARSRALSVAGLDLQAWESWITYRAQRKPAIKATSLVAAAEELAGFGSEQGAVVKHSIANGYQGLFAPKAGLNGKHPEDTGWRPSK